MKSPGADPKSSLSTPPSEPVEWEVRIDGAAIEDAAPGVVLTGASGQHLSRRRIPHAIHVRAKTWIEARAEAVREWARRGLLVNPQSIREGRILT